MKESRMVKNFRCSIWGDIEVSQLALSIIDTWEFQRLHYIKQTSLAYKVFPTATSSRFEHSLGVYHITKVIIEHLEKDIDCNEKLLWREKELLGIIGLLHDIGHGPFSHLFDIYLEKSKIDTIPIHHEDRSALIFRSMVNKYKLDFLDEEVDWICQRITLPPNEKWYDTLVCNPYSSFDTDKLDYLIRDTKHFGIPCSFDINRILQNIRIIDNKLCFCDRIYTDIEKLFTIREELHKYIYRHPTIEKFQDYLLENLNISITSLEEFLDLNDIQLLSTLPKETWIKLETRTWDTFHFSQKKMDYSDEQKKRALENILWYKRKEPLKFFYKK